MTTELAVELLENIENDNAEQAMALLKKGASATARNRFGVTALHMASAGGHIELMDTLINMGAAIDAPTLLGWTPLHDAAADGQGNSIQKLIRSGAAVDAETDEGDTPLHEAVREGQYNAVEVLLSQQAPVRYVNDNGDTPLHTAVRAGDLTIMRLLLSHGAPVFAKNASMESPVDIAKKLNDEDAMDLLEQLGESADIIDEENEHDPDETFGDANVTMGSDCEDAVQSGDDMASVGVSSPQSRDGADSERNGDMGGGNIRRDSREGTTTWQLERKEHLKQIDMTTAAVRVSVLPSAYDDKKKSQSGNKPKKDKKRKEKKARSKDDKLRDKDVKKAEKKQQKVENATKRANRKLSASGASGGESPVQRQVSGEEYTEAPSQCRRVQIVRSPSGIDMKFTLGASDNRWRVQDTSPRGAAEAGRNTCTHTNTRIMYSTHIHPHIYSRTSNTHTTNTMHPTCIHPTPYTHTRTRTHTRTHNTTHTQHIC
eukprot:m.725121 g.725121  ORF g.725121 m.725121 type:complete len:486 (-) comp23026_c0_seq5:20-1477(-)